MLQVVENNYKWDLTHLESSRLDYSSIFLSEVLTGSSQKYQSSVTFNTAYNSLRQIFFLCYDIYSFRNNLFGSFANNNTVALEKLSMGPGSKVRWPHFSFFLTHAFSISHLFICCCCLPSNLLFSPYRWLSMNVKIILNSSLN